MSGGAGIVVPNPPSKSVSFPDTGGAVKPSQILGAVSAGSGALGALAPIAAPIAIPLSILTGLGSSIASIFGGRLTEKEMNMLAMIKHRVERRKKMGLN